MSVQKEDYRTNRADFAIASTRGQAVSDDGVRDEPLAMSYKSVWPRDRRSARLPANPAKSSSGPRAGPRR
ncbi:hypothetical protein EB233_13460 [Mesorhizobium erdmanii]|uniref:Uncharacterized protein n=1 Tax=Mesorhizobium erdmanii TaxID=1777866 RepID=A0A6M7URR8_9HYPH|nr:hypothetical protein EB233_13460 [Mesorhizobium erdmanii]